MFASILVHLAPVHASDISVGVGVEYSTGDYGTGEDVDSLTVPFTLGWYPGRFDFELTIPWVRQSRTDTVRMGGWRFVQGEMADSSSGMVSGRNRMTDGMSAESSDSQSGLGDTDLTVGYALVEESDRLPLLRPLLYVKFPTGDEDQALGTGAWDFGGGVGLAKMAHHWSFYAEGMYVVPGSSDTFNPDPYWTGTASASRRIGEHFRPGISVSGATAPFPGEPDSLEIKGRLTWYASQRTGIRGYVARGLSDGSPEWGGGLSLFNDF